MAFDALQREMQATANSCDIVFHPTIIVIDAERILSRRSIQINEMHLLQSSQHSRWNVLSSSL